jgi:hypothetical protein
VAGDESAAGRKAEEMTTSETHCAESCLGFDDLFRAVHGRGMDVAEREGLRQLDQAALNRWVHEQVVLCSNQMWAEDRLGNDGITYTAFGRRV